VHAMEAAAGVVVEGPVRALRRLLYCGEWIESHGLHVFMLHAPDFLGLPDGIALAAANRPLVEKGLALKKAGNAIVATLGGREIHPINVRPGGFHRAPRKAELAALVEPLTRARDIAREVVAWTAALEFPDFERDYCFVALRHGAEYPFSEGRIVSSRGLDITPDDFEAHVTEIHEPHSNALHAELNGVGPYLTGPLARYALNRDLLTPLAKEAAQAAGIGEGCSNPYKSIIVRAVEMLFACEEALSIIAAYEEPERPWIEVSPRDATGAWATEAPRGLLYHRYRIDADGLIAEANIVPPTSQNQRSIEEDLREAGGAWADYDDARLQHLCEQAIRNHDPCISCATHFLRLDVDRGAAEPTDA
jgi:sulfhydrogenase subunit alpha